VTYTGANSVTLGSGDITLNSTGDAAGTVSVSGSGVTTRTVTISSITGTGALGISISGNTASDAVGNQATAEGPSATFGVAISVFVSSYWVLFLLTIIFIVLGTKYARRNDIKL